MRYLSYILYPLCIGGAVYSLVYVPHKSWWSWTIQSVVNGVYAFGFLFMLPQLFVNYKVSIRNVKRVTFLDHKTYFQSPSAQIGGAPPLAGLHVQGVQHLHRRPVRLYHHHADSAPGRLLQG